MAFTPPSHTVYQWQNSPSTGTPLDSAHLEAAEQDLVNLINQVAEILGLGPTAVQTTNYTAVASDLVPVNTTSNAVTITLPSAPADQSLVGVILVAGTNPVTINVPSGAAFNITGGATSTTLKAVGQSLVVQYNASGNLYYIRTNTFPLNTVNGAAQLGSDASVGGPGGSPLNTAAVTTIGNTVYLQKANNLSDLASESTARVNLGVAYNPTTANIQPDGTATLGNTGYVPDAGHVHPTDTTRQAILVPTAIQTLAYTANVNDLVACDISGGNVTVTLPTAPPNGSVVGVECVNHQASPIGSSSSAGTLNAVTITTGGTDVFDITGGPTTHTIRSRYGSFLYQYNAGIWHTRSTGITNTSPWVAVGPITNVTQNETVQWCIDRVNNVQIRGNITTTASIAANTTLWTLPTYAAPTQTMLIANSLVIGTNGTVKSPSTTLSSSTTLALDFTIYSTM